MLAVSVLTTGRFKGATLWMRAFILMKTPEAPTGSPCLSPPFAPPRTPPPRSTNVLRKRKRGFPLPENAALHLPSAGPAPNPPAPPAARGPAAAAAAPPCLEKGATLGEFVNSWEQSKANGVFVGAFPFLGKHFARESHPTHPVYLRLQSWLFL